MATVTATRRREYIPYVSEVDRERKKQRCSVCHAMVVLPCYACWLRRYVARGQVYDPRDPSPHKHDRLQIEHMPRIWSNAKVMAFWNATVRGENLEVMSKTFRLPRHMAEQLRNELLEHAAKHPELI